MFIPAFALVFVAMAIWSVAVPLFSAPDEPTHVMRAAAVDRGELLGELVDGPSSPFALVHLPEYYSDVRDSPTCYHHDSKIPASCSPATPTTCPPKLAKGHPVCGTGFIYDARYPPLYYWIVGLPSLLGVGNAFVYLMRLLSAALCASFVALAITAVLRWSRSRRLLVGVAVATTPMVIYLGGVVNPSSLEIAAAISTWTCGVILVREHLVAPPSGLVVATALSASVFVLTRGLSPLWLALLALALLVVHVPGELRAFLGRKNVRIALGLVAVVGVVALVWILKEHTLLVFSTTKVPHSVPRLNVIETSFSRDDFYISELIGVFGDFDTWSPTLTYIVWYALIGAVVAGARHARRREVAALGVLTLAIVCIPVAISSSQAYKVGYVWTGRDTLPLAVGLPILAAGLWRERTSQAGRERLGAIVGLLAALAQFAALFEAVRRYAVGTSGPDFAFLTRARWEGPVPNVLVIAAEAVVLIVGYVALAHLVDRGGPLEEPTPAAASARTPQLV